MSSFTQNLPLNDRWYSWDNIKASANSFNKNVELGLDTVSNLSKIYSLGSMGTSSIAGAIESSRRKNVNASIKSLDNINREFIRNPEAFKESDLEPTSKYLENIKRYTDIYDRKPLSDLHSNLVSKYKQTYSDFAEKLSSDNFAKKRDDLIEQNNIIFRKQFATGNAFDGNKAYSQIMNEVDVTQDYIDRSSVFNKLHSSLLRTIPESFSIAFNTYKENRNINTRAGITKSLNAISDASRIVRESKSSFALRILLDMKYDYAVKSESWRS